MEAGDLIRWTYPLSGKTESGVILSIDRWTTGDSDAKDIKIMDHTGELRYICDLDAPYLGLEVISESR